MTGSINIRASSRLIAIVLASMSTMCSDKIVLPPMEDQIARPVSITGDAKGEFFYILNADLKHRHEDGSILVVDRAGNRKVAYSVDRLGRHIYLKGNDLLVTFDRNVGKGATSKVELYSVATSGGAMPRLDLKKSWDIDDCNPINGIIEGSTIAVSCQSGKLLLGELTSNRSDSTLDKIRHYPSFVRRALYIDSERELLFAFVTDWGTPTLQDRVYTDTKGVNKDGDIVDNAPNEVPDELERTAQARQKLNTKGSEFQFAVIDLRKEKSARSDGHYQFRSYEKTAATEMRWMHFNLKHQNGDSDLGLGSGQRYYRTNFWSAQPDLKVKGVFYLSQRASGKDDTPQYANNIVKVTIDPNTRREDILDLTKSTASIMTFARVFGHKDTRQTSGDRYLGDFALAEIGGQTVVLVNSFRSLANFRDEDFALFVAPLDPSQAKDKTTVERQDNLDRSYFSLAVAPKTDSAPLQVVVPSFYGDNLNFFTVGDDLSLTLTKTIP